MRGLDVPVAEVGPRLGDADVGVHLLYAAVQVDGPEPIRAQYSGHVTCIDQSEASITCLCSAGCGTCGRC